MYLQFKSNVFAILSVIYKITKGSKELKASFFLWNLLKIFVIPLGFKPKTFRTGI